MLFLMFFVYVLGCYVIPLWGKKGRKKRKKEKGRKKNLIASQNLYLFSILKVFLSEF